MIILSGPSGVGKGTVREELFKDDSLNLSYSISMTTRKPRPTETDGVDYFFVTDETFDSMIQKDDFLEYAKYVSHSYGTPRSYVEENLNLGKNVILEIEIQGALKVKEKIKDAVLMFVTAPDAGTSQLMNIHTSPHAICSLSLFLISSVKSSGLITLTQGPKDNTRITISVSSVA